MSYRRLPLYSYLCRIVALADLLDLVCWRVLLRDEVRHADDFVLFVIFDHISLLDYRHKVFGMADLALEPTPDLQNILSACAICHAQFKAVNTFAIEPQDRTCPYLITR